jgi:hypothetical protein
MLRAATLSTPLFCAFAARSTAICLLCPPARWSRKIWLFFGVQHVGDLALQVILHQQQDVVQAGEGHICV